MARAKTFLEEGRTKVEAMLEGDVKDEILDGLEWSEMWYEYTREMIEKGGD
jgi:hypothetical protein